MFGADGVMVGECGSVVDERLLGRLLDVKVLVQFTSGVLLEAEGEVNACAALIGVADVASGPGLDAAFLNAAAQLGHRALVERKDVAPDGGSLTDVGGDITIEQEIADVREVVLSRFERFSGGGTEA